MKKSLKMGLYSILTVLLVIFVVALVITGFNKLPSKVTEIDLSTEQMSSLSEQSVKVTEGVSREVTLYWILRSGTDTDQSKTVGLLLNRYAELNPKVKVVTLDPDENPRLRQKYDISLLYNNSVIAESELRYRYVPNTDIYVTVTQNEDESLDEYSSYQYFDGERAITSAISFVNTEEVPKAYVLEGHGEEALPEEFADLLKRENIETETLSLLAGMKVPEDADLVIIHGPEKDYSAEETEALQAYVNGGGKILLTTYAEDSNKRPNLQAFLEKYGLREQIGVIWEEDPNAYASDNPYCIIPTILSHEITDPLIDNNLKMLTVVCSGISYDRDALPAGVTVTPLLKTSERSYLEKITDATEETGETAETAAEPESIAQGPFTVAVWTEKTVDENKSGVILWVASGYVTAKGLDDYVSGTNYDFLSNSLNALVGHTDNIAIAYKRIASLRVNATTKEATLWTILLSVALPALILGIGAFILIRRNRR